MPILHHTYNSSNVAILIFWKFPESEHESDPYLQLKNSENIHTLTAIDRPSPTPRGRDIFLRTSLTVLWLRLL
jgi:hypothetical protein